MGVTPRRSGCGATGGLRYAESTCGGGVRVRSRAVTMVRAVRAFTIATCHSSANGSIRARMTRSTSIAAPWGSSAVHPLPDYHTNTNHRAEAHSCANGRNSINDHMGAGHRFSRPDRDRHRAHQARRDVRYYSHLQEWREPGTRAVSTAGEPERAGYMGMETGHTDDARKLACDQYRRRSDGNT
jgi:hypothetical protein